MSVNEMAERKKQMKVNESKAKLWFKRIGLAGIIFFTVKGTVSLTLIVLAAFGLSKCGG